MNTLTNEIVIRAYDKFFNIGERRETEFAALKDQLVFPVRAWVKENGYLGLVGYDATLGDLTDESHQHACHSSAKTDGETTRQIHSPLLFSTQRRGHLVSHHRRHLFLQSYGKHVDVIRQYLAEHNVCLVCEVILPTEDPHIISSSTPRIRFQNE